MYHFNAVGRIASEIELKYAEGTGKAVARFNFAFDDPDAKDSTTFLPLVAFEKTAENIANYKKKGDELAVFIKVKNNNYEKDGKKKYGYSFIASRVKFIGRRED